MQIRAEEITEVIKRQLTGFESAVEVKKVGSVLQVGDGIVKV